MIVENVLQWVCYLVFIGLGLAHYHHAHVYIGWAVLLSALMTLIKIMEWVTRSLSKENQ